MTVDERFAQLICVDSTRLTNVVMKCSDLSYKYSLFTKEFV